MTHWVNKGLVNGLKPYFKTIIFFTKDLLVTTNLTSMAKIPPFHSIRQHVYHDDTACPEATKIQTLYKRQGTGAKNKCPYCRKNFDQTLVEVLPVKPAIV